MAITEDYVSFETAKLLKEKGFLNEIDLRITQNLSFYDNIGLTHNLDKYYDRLIQDKIDFVVAPTLQMAMKWLREVHNLCLFIIPATIDETFRTGYALYPQCDSKWEWCASKNDGSKATFGFNINIKYCDSYEQACEEAIKYSLENLI